MERRLTQRGKERRQQLLAYSTQRFAERGYHPTSVADIVAGLGVGKGVFYWYFESKEQLMHEVLREAHRSLRRAQQDAIGEEPDPVRRIELGIRASMAWFDKNRNLVNLFQFAASEERFAPAMRRGQEVAIADTVRHVKDAVVEGRVGDTDPDLLAHAILGVTGQLARAFIHERTASVDDVADAAVAFCLEGLSGR
jgi:AcrR family transcriptional regulator